MKQTIATLFSNKDSNHDNSTHMPKLHHFKMSESHNNETHTLEIAGIIVSFLCIILPFFQQMIS